MKPSCDQHECACSQARRSELPELLLPNVFYWSIFSEEKKFYFNGYLIQSRNSLLIIDPPSASRELFEAIQILGEPTVVILTNADHERESDQFRQHFKIPILAPKCDAPLLTVKPDQTFEDNDVLPGGLKVIHLANQKTPGESALYHPEQSLMILGDALIGNPPGVLNMLPAEKYTDPQKAFQSLKKLADVDMGLQTLLLGDGEPILTNAQQTLELFFINHFPT